MSDQPPLAWQTELQQAAVAYRQKRYGDARAHLAQAKRGGAPVNATQRLERAIHADEQDQQKRGSNSGWVGFFGAALVYLLLSFLPLSPPVRMTLALLVIPALCGYAIGRMMGWDAGDATRFWRGAKMTGYALFWYALANLIWVRTRYPMGAETGQVFWVWVLVATVYALIGGLVGGTVSAKLTWLGTRKESNGTAS
jgi:hypothetical protein